MAITDLFNQLEKAVADAKDKQSKADSAAKAAEVAQKTCSDAWGLVESLKNELTNLIGDMLPSGRVRQSQ